MVGHVTDGEDTQSNVNFCQVNRTATSFSTQGSGKGTKKVSDGNPAPSIRRVIMKTGTVIQEAVSHRPRGGVSSSSEAIVNLLNTTLSLS